METSIQTTARQLCETFVEKAKRLENYSITGKHVERIAHHPKLLRLLGNKFAAARFIRSDQSKHNFEYIIWQISRNATHISEVVTIDEHRYLLHVGDSKRYYLINTSTTVAAGIEL
jgi:hypothetical protein